MSRLIEEFYKETGTSSILLAKKMSSFDRNQDIASEFEYWIDHKQYRSNGIEEQGYTAEKLSMLSEYLNGEGAFILLMELREDPQKALKRIRGGFKKK